ncbi:DUF2231 domain-containing protein [Sulfurimonas sp.]|uniref:DUF2231 domain-containing protein n=1 Tax=Sulfurimonas sp. TaxID=2022749 RepID=UPI0035644FEA
MLHPAAAHFAVALPIISLVLGLAYLYKPSELMSKVSSRFMVFAAIFIIAAFFTGKHDGGEVYILLSGEGKQLLLQHKQLGLYLAIAMGIAAVIKFYGCYKQVFKAEIFAIVLVAIIAGGTLYQGKMGGDLTYTYGAHVKDHSDGMDCLAEAAEDEADD